MAVLGISTSQVGTVGVVPGIVNILTNDTVATVTTAGYLNNAVAEGFSFPANSMALVVTSDGGTNWYQIIKSGANTSLFTSVPAGAVALPVIVNHIASFVNVDGEIGDQAVTAINKGGLQAGLSGTAGSLSSFPSTGSKGSFAITAVANTGDTVTTLSNVAMGQASVLSLPDPANAIGRVLVGATATPFTSGNIVKASGTGGLMVDAGVAPAALQLSANIKANKTASIGGAGAGPISVAVAGLTTSSIITASIASSSNTVEVAKCIATNTGFDITFSGDPGAACVVNYVAFVVAQ